MEIKSITFDENSRPGIVFVYVTLETEGKETMLKFQANREYEYHTASLGNSQVPIAKDVTLDSLMPFIKLEVGDMIAQELLDNWKKMSDLKK